LNIKLLQRLSPSGVTYVLDNSGDGQLSPEASRVLVAQRSAMLSYAASGGHKDPFVTGSIGERLREIARGSGFPENANPAACSRFDRDAAIYLAEVPELSSGEGLRDDVWAYIATVVVPDVVDWRFPGRSPERFHGGVRNALQRLWIRGRVLDRGPDASDRWGLLDKLKEDAAVQIFERPGIFGQRPLATALAEGYVRALEKGGQGLEGVMRRATKLLRLRNEVYDLGGLPHEELCRVVDECFTLAAKDPSQS
jgi:hypothetical protein